LSASLFDLRLRGNRQVSSTGESKRGMSCRDTYLIGAAHVKSYFCDGSICARRIQTGMDRMSRIKSRTENLEFEISNLKFSILSILSIPVNFFA
jgi:hypothetical protein